MAGDGAIVSCTELFPAADLEPSAAEALRMVKRKRWLVVGLAGLTVFVVLAVRWAWVLGPAFDPALWQDEDQVRQGVRLEMADRLLARRTLVGKTRAQVVELLGEPPPTAYFTDWDLVYRLGPERGYFSIDSEWLVLRLGADGRVMDNRVVRD
jgi:hypothetical protein